MLIIIASALIKSLHHCPYFDGKTVIFVPQNRGCNNFNENKGNGAKLKK
jgi:hypothetical protein